MRRVCVCVCVRYATPKTAQTTLTCEFVFVCAGARTREKWISGRCGAVIVAPAPSGTRYRNSVRRSACSVASGVRGPGAMSNTIILILLFTVRNWLFKIRGRFWQNIYEYNSATFVYNIYIFFSRIHFLSYSLLRIEIIFIFLWKSRSSNGTAKTPFYSLFSIKYPI